jgi:hypothetical protein
VNTKALNSLAELICRAQEQDRTPMGIAFAIDSAGRHMSPETAAELERLGTRVDEVERKYTFDTAALKQRIAQLEAERHSTNEALDDAVKALRADRDRIAEMEAQREALTVRLRAGQHWQRGHTPELVSENLVSQSELREIFSIPLTAPWEDKPATKCRCDEPGADPYECEADDCSGHFSELNPFGGGPVQGHDAKVFRVCGMCGWRTSVWHVADGSADEELHGHVAQVHGGAAPDSGSLSHAEAGETS